MEVLRVRGSRPVQMGGPQGVRDNEVYFVTIQPKERLNMHAIPRPTKRS
jgi:hypothetical protein